MRIKFITFTGADDNTPIQDLVNFTQTNPRVEWGLLLSLVKGGSPRYPSADWWDKFYLDDSHIFQQCSGHVCGKAAVQISYGSWDMLDSKYASLFPVYQINLFGFKEPVSGGDFVRGLSNTLADAIVIQADGVHDYMADFDIYKASVDTRVLYDKSGGNGIVGDYSTPHPTHFSGYAGGFTPDNIIEELKKLEQVVGDREIWIDMESGVRTNNFFDLNKCKRVYDLVYSKFEGESNEEGK